MNGTIPKGVVIGVIALLILLGFSFFVFQNQLGNEPNEIKIGVIGGFTGIGAYYGEQQRRGVELAAEEINQNGGINGKPIKLLFEDDETQDVKAVSAIKKLIEVDGVRYVVGGAWNSTTAAMVPVANSKEVILISPVSVLSDLSKDDYFFRTVSSIKDLMNSLAQHSHQNGIKKVAILATNTAFGIEHVQSFKEAFEKEGGVVVATEMVALGQLDVKTELEKIKATNPEAILNIYSSGPPTGLPMKQAKELGITVQWLASFGGESQPLITEYGSVVDGLTYAYPFDLADSAPATQQFVKKYGEKYGQFPDFSAAGSYDALRVLALTIQNAGDNPQKVKTEILAITNYEGASGIISFDANEDVQKSIIIKKIQNGKFVKISN